MTVKDAVGPHAYHLAQALGYLVFTAAWVFVALTVIQALLELWAGIARFSVPRRRLSPLSARPARVIAFHAKEARHG